MPFVPIKPDEIKKYNICTSKEHNPPSHMVIYKPMKWVCPLCGHSTILYPTNTHLYFEERNESTKYNS